MSVPKIIWECGENCMLEVRGGFDLSDKVASSGLFLRIKSTFLLEVIVYF